MATPPPEPPLPPPAPGWYPDPAGGGQRYWDGNTWTDHSIAQMAAPSPPVVLTAGQKQKKKIKYFSLGLLVLLICYNAAIKPVVERRAEERKMDSWAEVARPIVEGNPRLWLDYAEAEALSDFQPVCAKMRQRWVVDLQGVMPAPDREIDDLLSDVIDAAKSATDACLALTPSSSQSELLALDAAMTTLQERWMKAGKTMVEKSEPY